MGLVWVSNLEARAKLHREVLAFKKIPTVLIESSTTKVYQETELTGPQYKIQSHQQAQICIAQIYRWTESSLGVPQAVPRQALSRPCPGSILHAHPWISTAQ
jgi:hypothetical protein